MSEQRPEEASANVAGSNLTDFALKSADEGLWEWSRETGVIKVSPRCREILGTAPSDSLVFDEDWRDIVAPPQLERLVATVKHAFDTEPHEFELQFRLSPSAGDRWVSCKGRRAADCTGEGSAIMVGSLTDITRRKEIEDALLESEHQLRTLIESQGEGLGLVDEDERFTFVNPAAEDIFGVPRGQMVGMSLRSFVDDEEYQRIVEQTSRRRKGERSTYEMSFSRSSGEKRTLLVTATPRVDEQGEYSGAFGVFRDITDRKRAEDALREEQERYLQLIESLPLGVGIITGRKIAYANQATLDMLGYASLDKAVGLDAFEPLADGEAERVLENLADLMSGRDVGPVHYFARAKRTDGAFVPLEVFVTRVAWKGEVAYQVVMMDVSERQEAEKRRAELEQQLRLAQKMESLGRLAGGIAHDFNNLLTPIMSMAELTLQDASEDDPHHDDLRSIVESAKRARDLTQQLLAFGRKAVLRMRVVDLNAVVRDAHEMLHRLIPESITMKLELDAELWNVKGDESQLHQILLNLTLNARDSMPHGGRITIATTNVTLADERPPRFAGAEPGDYVLITVADEGEGMDADTVSRAFDPFFSTKAWGEGSGLGLATVDGVVTQHGGQVSLESSPGQGSTFFILLPRFDAPAMEIARGSSERRSVPPGSTVLVVEDEPSVRRSACRILRRAGYKVIDASDGSEALALAARYKGRIHVMLTDVIMPGMKGDELSRRLTDRRPDTAVIFMSGHADDVIAAHGELEGDLAFLQKPFSMESLLESVATAARR